MTPLERAARALPQMLGPHAFDDLPLDRKEQRELGRHGHIFDHTQADMLDLARAVLQAIREPSEGMIEVGASAHDHDCGPGTIGRANGSRNSRQIWSAMIAAALTE